MNDAELDQLLRALPARVEFTPAFQRYVWSRIETETRHISPWSDLFSSLARRLLHPLPLAGAAALVITAGAWLGRVSAPPPDGATAYLQAVSPFTGMLAATEE